MAIPYFAIAAGAVHLPESAVGAQAEEIVRRLLYQIVLILVATRMVTLIVRRLGQTDVSGEILAGILLGPSFLGAITAIYRPGMMERVFHPSTSVIFTGLAQVGLVLLMFQIGLEFDFQRHLAAARKSIVAVSLSGLLLPLIIGYVSAPWFHDRLPEVVKPGLLGFRLFFAVAMSITAIPILGRIFMELGLSHTRTAALTIGAAAIDDVCGWLLLGGISILVQGKPLLIWAGPRLLGLVGYLIFVFLVARPVLKRFTAAHLQLHGGLRLSGIASLLIVIFGSATVTSNLGVFAIIGAFVIGVSLHDDRQLVDEWKLRVAPLVQTLLLPIFFVYTGLRTDIGTIRTGTGLRMFGLVLAIAFSSKFVGGYVASRLIGENHRSACTVGVCMNTRALMELIVLNIGLDLRVLTPSIFTILVGMALVSTFMATPLVRWLMRGQQWQEEQCGVVHATPPSGRPQVLATMTKFTVSQAHDTFAKGGE